VFKSLVSGSILKLGLIASVMTIVALGGSAARAEDVGATPPAKKAKRTHSAMPAAVPMTAPAAGPSASSRLDTLSGEVGNMRAAQSETGNEVKKIQQAITVAPPATADAAPQTIGEHVAVIEKTVEDTRKNLADNLGVHVHGLIDAGYNYNLNNPNTSGSKGGGNAFSPGGQLNQLRVFDQDANSFQLTQYNLHIDRSVEGGVGFVLDLNFGKVAEIVRASTRYSNNNPPGTSADIMDLTQAYATYTIPVGKGINISAGKFVTLLGEETINTYNNLNYNESKSYIFGFGIPFTHTGIRAQYSLTDKIGLTAGINNGWDDVSDNNSGKSFEGQVALTPTDTLSLVINGMYGPEQVNHGNSKRGIIDPIATWKTPLKGLTAIGEYLYAHEGGPVTVFPAYSSHGNSLNLITPDPNTGFLNTTGGVDWQGAAGYLVYDLNDRIQLAARGEYFRDSDGARTGLRQSLGEFTQTLTYKLTGNLLTRYEYRHDESNAKPFFGNQVTITPAAGVVNAATLAGQDTFSGSAIFVY
jgi:hypothetical protein